MTSQERFDGLPPWVQEELKRPINNERLRAMLNNPTFHVDEAKFTDWHERMATEYHELAKKYKTLQEIRERMPKENMVMNEMPLHIKAALDSKAVALFFSPDNLAKQLSKHPDLTMAEYVKVLNELKYDTNVYDRGKRHIGVAITIDDRHYRVVIKPTKNDLEAYLTSLCYMDKHGLKTFCNSPILHKKGAKIKWPK